MQISESFKTAQRRVFQDKTVSLRPAAVTTGAYNSEIRGPGAIASTASVNFQIIADRLIAEEYGLTIGKDAVMTCSDAVAVGKGDYIQYGGIVYLVAETPRFDSHFRWLLRATDEVVV